MMKLRKLYHPTNVVVDDDKPWERAEIEKEQKQNLSMKVSTEHALHWYQFIPKK